MKKVYIPHIHYTVYLKDVSQAKGEAKNLLSTKHAIAERIDKANAVIYMKLPLKQKDWGTLGHEIIHILQYICASRNIDFVYEQENVAYMFQYIFAEFTNYRMVQA